jgi:hypothetical protein
MLAFDAVSGYLLVLALATLLVAVLVWQPHRSQRTIIVWLASGVVGVLLGITGSYAGMRLAGYELAVAPPPVTAGSAASAGDSGPGMSCPMTGGEMKGMAGMKGMPGMGMGGMGGPRPKRDLTTLVQQLDLLTGDIGITLSAEQAAAVSNCLRDVEKPAKMSDDDAKAKHDRLMAVLNENQKARLEAIGRLQPAPSGGPGMTCPMTGAPMPAMMMSGGPGPTPDQDQNPFQQDAEGKALKSLRERLASKGAAPKAETPKGSPPKTETPKAPPPKAEPPKRS